MAITSLLNALDLESPDQLGDIDLESLDLDKLSGFDLDLDSLTKRYHELDQRLVALSHNQQEAQNHEVVVFGLLKAGKSSLLNALTNQVDYFKEGVTRQTVSNQQYLDNSGSQTVLYIDTPGLDANEQDDVEATKGLELSNIVLFVHNCNGEFDAREMKCLSQLKELYAEGFDQHVILVLSQFDKKLAADNGQAQVDHIKERLLTQVREISPEFSEANICQVSSRMYQTGAAASADKKREILQEKSGVVALRKLILAKGNELSNIAIKNLMLDIGEVMFLAAALATKKKQNMEQLESKLSSYQSKLDRYNNSLDSEVDKIKGLLKQEQCAKKELEDI